MERKRPFSYRRWLFDSSESKPKVTRWRETKKDESSTGTVEWPQNELAIEKCTVHLSPSLVASDAHLAEDVSEDCYDEFDGEISTPASTAKTNNVDSTQVPTEPTSGARQLGHDDLLDEAAADIQTSGTN